MTIREAILNLLIDGPIIGITRLQKLLFLVEQEGKIVLNADFEPYRFGPFSKKVQDDIDFLINMGYIESSCEKFSLNQKKRIEDVYNMSAKDLLSHPISNSETTLDDDVPADFIEEDTNKEPIMKKDNVVYRLTEKGKEYLRKFPNQVNSVQKIRGKYKNMSLTDLLSYVYSHYPNFTTESEIKDKIL